MCLCALGLQTGGSLTRPASYCGVATCKPSFGAVSVDGVLPLSPSMDHVGPIARCVHDLAILLKVIAGQESRPSCAGVARRNKFIGANADASFGFTRRLVPGTRRRFGANQSGMGNRAASVVRGFGRASGAPRRRSARCSNVTGLSWRSKQRLFTRCVFGSIRMTTGRNSRLCCRRGWRARPLNMFARSRIGGDSWKSFLHVSRAWMRYSFRRNQPRALARNHRRPRVQFALELHGLSQRFNSVRSVPGGLPLAIERVRPRSEFGLLATAAWCENSLEFDFREPPF